jgi:septal ring factor EnvC (AmiA/AmiB activator)
MTMPRRRLIRPTPQQAIPSPNAHSPPKLRAKLAKQRSDLARWLRKLRRAFNAADKHHRAIARLERQINQLEGA